MQDKIAVARTVVLFVAGRSVGNVVTKTIKYSVPTNNPLEKAELVVGSFVLAGMVADKALDWTGARFDTTVDAVQNLRARMSEDAPEEEDSTEE